MDAAAVVREDRLGAVRHVAGGDVAYAEEGGFCAAVAVLDVDTLAVVEVASVRGREASAYVPGDFARRELEPLLRAFEALREQPELVLCDAHGLAHPQRFGLACRLGVALDIPAIGCAKRRLCGAHTPPAPARGSEAPLLDAGEVIGAVLRTQESVRPVYVSIGHRVSLATACAWVLRLAPRFRIPEPLRAADRAARQGIR
jgi:deoxyribonuclease V